MFDNDVNINISADPSRGIGAEPKPNGPRSRKGIETRARLVDAAKHVFERDGFLDARISDIAEAAGLSHGSFYHYFESKEQVFREVATEVDELLASPINDVILDPSSPATPQERIRTAIRLHLERYRDECRIMTVIEQVSRFDPQLPRRPGGPAPPPPRPGRGLHSRPSGPWAGGRTPRPGDRRGGVGLNDLPLPRTVVRRRTARLRSRPRCRPTGACCSSAPWASLTASR